MWPKDSLCYGPYDLSRVSTSPFCRTAALCHRINSLVQQLLWDGKVSVPPSRATPSLTVATIYGLASLKARSMVKLPPKIEP